MPDAGSAPAAATIAVQEADGATVLALTGRLDANGVAALWVLATEAAGRAGRLTVEADGVVYCDGSGVTLLGELRRIAGDRPFAITGLKPQFGALLDMVGSLTPPADRTDRQYGLFGGLGRAAYGVASEMHMQLAFIGELIVSLGGGIL